MLSDHCLLLLNLVENISATLLALSPEPGNSLTISVIGFLLINLSTTWYQNTTTIHLSSIFIHQFYINIIVYQFNFFMHYQCIIIFMCKMLYCCIFHQEVMWYGNTLHTYLLDRACRNIQVTSVDVTCQKFTSLRVSSSYILEAQKIKQSRF